MTNTMYHKDRSSWHYIDLEDFEYQIRQEMTSDSVYCRRKARQRKAAERKAKHYRRIYFAIQRLVGLCFVVGTILAMFIVRNYGADVTFALITIPIGLMMVFSKDMCLAIGRRKHNRGHAGA